MHKDLTDLMDHIDGVGRQRINGFHPILLHVYGHGRRLGLVDETIRKAIVQAALRGRSLVCCPLGDLDAAAAVIPNLVASGMTAKDVRAALGDPQIEETRTDAVYWYYGLPYDGRKDPEGDDRTYAERQLAWPSAEVAQDAPPFPPLFEGERMFQALRLIEDVVVGQAVVVLSTGERETFAKP